MYEAAFRDLRKLADWFSNGGHESLGPAVGIDRLVRRLGTTAVPLLCRELLGGDPTRRDVARDALETIATQDAAARERVTAELHAITAGPAPDDAKVVALGLLSELGEHADVQFADPTTIRTRSAIALAAHLESAADVAGAADLMVRQLDTADILQMLEVMVSAAPDAAHRLSGELAVRLDLASDVRDRVALVAATIETAAPAYSLDDVHRYQRTSVAVLVHAAGRRVAIASLRQPASASARAGEPRWRRWAVLIDAHGRIADCMHEDDAGPHGDTASLTAELCADGYRVATTDRDHAHDVVAAAARLTAEATGELPSSYYLGRDLLALADAHLEGSGRDPATVARSRALARAIELVAAGDHPRALAMLDRCDPDHPDAAAALAAVLLADNRPAAAVAALDRALAVEPDWPLHHWNLAIALRRLGDARGCGRALERFLATSALPSGLAGDPDQPARLAAAHRMIAEIERSARMSDARPPHRPTPRPSPSPRAAHRRSARSPEAPPGSPRRHRGKRRKRGSAAT